VLPGRWPMKSSPRRSSIWSNRHPTVSSLDFASHLANAEKTDHQLKSMCFGRRYEIKANVLCIEGANEVSCAPRSQILTFTATNRLKCTKTLNRGWQDRSRFKVVANGLHFRCCGTPNSCCGYDASCVRTPSRAHENDADVWLGSYFTCQSFAKTR
jgi:hypothetical protein